MLKPITVAKAQAVPMSAHAAPVVRVERPLMRVVLVTMDSHLASATQRATQTLVKAMPGLQVRIHAAAEFSGNPDALARCQSDIGEGDIVIASMLFLEDHFLPLLPALKARRDNCDAMVCAMSSGEVTKLTRMGKFDMQAPTSGAMAFLKKLRPKPPTEGAAPSKGTAGAAQMKMLRALPKPPAGPG